MITIKQNDTGIGLRATLQNENGAVDLIDASILFFMGSHEIAASVEDALNGRVLVYLDADHTDQARIFKAEFEVTFADGRVETFPNDGYVQVQIMKDLGGN